MVCRCGETLELAPGSPDVSACSIRTAGTPASWRCARSHAAQVWEDADSSCRPRPLFPANSQPLILRFHLHFRGWQGSLKKDTLHTGGYAHLPPSALCCPAAVRRGGAGTGRRPRTLGYKAEKRSRNEDRRRPDMRQGTGPGAERRGRDPREGAPAGRHRGQEGTEGSRPRACGGARALVRRVVTRRSGRKCH